MRILLVSQMYPSADEPDLGPFVAQVERALAGRGHDVDLAVLDTRAGGRLRYLDLARSARARVREARPDVVYAHFLVPSGLLAALASRAPLVVTAHGRDVRNVGTMPGVRAVTRLVVRRAAAVIAVSDYLRRELELKVPEARGKTEIVSSGVDLERFRPQHVPPGPTAYLCVGSLTERKNVLRLAHAFQRLGGDATLTFVGDGPFRPVLEGARGVTVVGVVPHDEIPRHLARSHVVCQPSLLEPLGQSLLEAMACARSVVASRVGGAAELVGDGVGFLVDPLDEDAIAAALRRAAALPRPNAAARLAAEARDVKLEAARIEAILARAARGRRA